MDEDALRSLALAAITLFDEGRTEDANYFLQYEIMPRIRDEAKSEVDHFLASVVLAPLAVRMSKSDAARMSWDEILSRVEASLQSSAFYNRIEFVARLSARCGWTDRAITHYERLREMTAPDAPQEDGEYYELALDSLIELYRGTGNADDLERLTEERDVYRAASGPSSRLWDP